MKQETGIYQQQQQQPFVAAGGSLVDAEKRQFLLNRVQKYEATGRLSGLEAYQFTRLLQQHQHQPLTTTLSNQNAAAGSSSMLDSVEQQILEAVVHRMKQQQQQQQQHQSSTTTTSRRSLPAVSLLDPPGNNSADIHTRSSSSLSPTTGTSAASSTQTNEDAAADQTLLPTEPRNTTTTGTTTIVVDEEEPIPSSTNDRGDLTTTTHPEPPVIIPLSDWTTTHCFNNSKASDPQSAQDWFVEMCFFARLGFAQPPSCLHCTYHDAMMMKSETKQNASSRSHFCTRWVVWRRNANLLLHPDTVADNAVLVQCHAVQDLLDGRCVLGQYRWNATSNQLVVVDVVDDVEADKEN